MHIVVHGALAEIDAQQWNALLQDNNPFMRHEFLHGLEVSNCVCEAHGWQPCHIAVYADNMQDALLGAMPCYIKQHSYGEYIFDWAWADAHYRHGLDYYPKLSNAVPFTPATGPRWLAVETDQCNIAKAMLERARKLVEEYNLSSFHSLFLSKQQAEFACSNQLNNRLSLRRSSQFHWHNDDYGSFDCFLAALTSKKRKNIKRERRRVIEQNIRYRWLSGAQLTPQAVEQMHAFYMRTIRRYGAQAYLTKKFFTYLSQSFAAQTLFLFADFEDQTIAGGLYFRSDNTLYGRYWGALHDFHSVHFETCYYQPIEWCIQHGYKQFEAGAQGEHKLARGLVPSATYSAHWIEHPQFRNAIDDFLEQEAEQVGRYQNSLQTHSPFRVEI